MIKPIHLCLNTGPIYVEHHLYLIIIQKNHYYTGRHVELDS